MTYSKRPPWISRDDFRAWHKPSALNTLARVDGIQPYSFVTRCERQGQPIRKTSDNRCRIMDIWVRARVLGLRFDPPDFVTMPKQIERLRQELEDIKAEISQQSQELDSLREFARFEMLSVSLVGSRLCGHDDIVANAAPYPRAACGVYFLIKNDEVVYVGQSVNVVARIGAHTADKDFDSWTYMPVDEKFLNPVEALYIHMLRPPLNYSRSGRLCAPISFDKLVAVVQHGHPPVYGKNIRGRRAEPVDVDDRELIDGRESSVRLLR